MAYAGRTPPAQPTRTIGRFTTCSWANALTKQSGLEKDLNWPWMEGKTTSPFPRSHPRGQNQPSTIESQALYRARRPRRKVHRRHRGKPARTVGGVPASNGMVVTLRGGTGV